MEIPFELPLDNDGYLRRQCPRCERAFKWHPDDDVRPSDEPSEPVAYHCPYCGEVSPDDQWWTDEQVDFAQGLASMEAMRLVEQQLRPTAEKINRSSGFIKMELQTPTVNPPAPLFETDDMIAVEPPCHPEEPIKVSEEWDEELHCLVCGKVFVLPT